MIESSKPSIQIELKAFNLHLHLNDRTRRTFHFDSPSLFFQAEDGIRDWSVTGVQTGALPIDRTSPRRISSLCPISYAVFCWSSDVCPSDRSEEHTSELQSLTNLVCRLLL